MKGQVLAISLVIAAAVSLYVMYLVTFQSLQLTQQNYYDQYRFAQIFATLKRAPLYIKNQISQIPGVSAVELRVSAMATLDIEGMAEPAVGKLVSIPERRRPMLNDLFIRRGRYIDPHKPNEILVSEGFALARGFEPGDRLRAVINGRLRNLEIVGIALSPEFIYAFRPGDFMPDDKRWGILWMEERALSSAFDMEGGFNDVAIRLTSDSVEEDVIMQLDHILEPYGGLGAIPRSLQSSHWFLNNELSQLRSIGTLTPIIFLAVAAFLLNVVLNRLVTVQREQIAALKAVGYSNLEVGTHYYKFGILVAGIGLGIGITSGIWLASSVLINLYNDFFRFPLLVMETPADIIGIAIFVTIAAALMGTHSAVLMAVRLPPADAIRPQVPVNYRVNLIDQVAGNWMSPSSRMILKNLARRPLRAVFSTFGIAFGAAIMVVALFFLDSMQMAMDVQFNVAERQDLTITFVETASPESLHEISNLSGVMNVEPMRSVPVRLRFGHRSRQAAITGLGHGTTLNRVIDSDLEVVELPLDGIVLSSTLGDILGAQVGDRIILEILEGARPVREVVVSKLVDEFLGTSAYMDLTALHGMLREGQVLSGAFVQVDSSMLGEVYKRFKETPAVVGVGLKDAAMRTFKDTIESNIAIIIFFNQIFSSIIAFGVIYCAARIALSERNWELASLRVIGFTKGEISYILLGEFVLLAMIAIPLGLLLGSGLAALIVATIGRTELYRIPLYVAPGTFGIAAAGIVVATVSSCLAVRRQLDRLDLVGVLKSRE